jgi:3-hydroxyisobutyrate dehydrogenase-like beta-hydroxyacid dehydrogenase
MRLAFLGLGQMGGPMAARLLAAGHHVAVWNRTSRKAAPLVDRGARRASSPRDAGQGAEAALTMLADPGALEEVLFGADGLAAGLGAGSTLIEMSTVGPEAVRRLAGRLPQGVDVVDAPVLGSVPQARDGALQVFVGGTEAQFGRWRGVLEAMGSPVHVGPLGAGASMKLVVNSTLGAIMAGLGEAMALGDALGLDQGAVLDVLAASSIGITARSKRRMIEAGIYPPNFKLALARKDMGLVSEAAEGAGLRLRVAPASGDWLAEADRDGLGDLDYSALVAHIRGKPAAG